MSTLAAEDLEGIRALTLQWPWAYAVTDMPADRRPKRVENRPWAPPANLVGGWFLIHAGVGCDYAAPPLWLLEVAKYARTGGIVGAARLAGVCSRTVPDVIQVPGGCECGVWAVDGQHHWQLDEVIVLEGEPVYCKGRQRLWYPEPATLARVAKRLGLS